MQKGESSEEDHNILNEFLALPEIGKHEIISLLGCTYPQLSESLSE